MDKTLLARIEQHKDRWSSFGADTGILHISEKLSAKELKRFALFQDYDDKFLELISPDVTVALWKKDAVLFEEGSFIDLAFYVQKGEVGVYLTTLGGESISSPPIFKSPGDLSRAMPSAGAPAASSEHYRRSQAQNEKSVTYLSVMDFDLPKDAAARLGEGEIFGEIGALSGWPQSVTAQALNDCELVQIRLPALRLMKRKSKAFKTRVDKLYRKRSLIQQLRMSPLFKDCAPGFTIHLAGTVELVSCEPGEVVVEEGKPADAVYLVRSGFMKMSQRVGEGQMALSYISKGMSFGEIELLIENISSWQFTVSSVGYGELVKIPREEFQRLTKDYPGVEKMLWEQAVARIKSTGSSKRSPEQSEFVQISLEQGLVEGNSILVIDLNQCTRCDDCVRGCSETHDGRPRFVREGNKFENFLVAKSCYHCQDPVCLIGCPTGAIRRANVGDVVEIREDVCIGCGTCGGNCPYDAIVMHDTGQTWPGDTLPKSLRGTARNVASKCDLCYTSELGPACVRSCPQGCAYRIGSVEEFRELLKGNV